MMEKQVFHTYTGRCRCCQRTEIWLGLDTQGDPDGSWERNYDMIMRQSFPAFMSFCDSNKGGCGKEAVFDLISINRAERK